MPRIIKASEIQVIESDSSWPVITSRRTAEGTPTRATVGSPAAVHQQVELLREDARREASAIIEEARAAAAEIEAAAAESGHAAGYEAGRAEAIASLERLNLICGSAVIEWERVVRQAEQDIVDLALAIASRIVGRIVEEDRSIVMASVMQALDHLAESPIVKIRVNPSDHALVSAHWYETRGASYRGRVWEILADRDVASGGCVLELEGGRIDAQLATQIAGIGQALHAAGETHERST